MIRKGLWLKCVRVSPGVNNCDAYMDPINLLDGWIIAARFCGVSCLLANICSICIMCKYAGRLLKFFYSIFFHEILMRLIVLPKTTTYEVPESPNKAQKTKIRKERKFARKLRLE